ncbi:hypothetical protein G6M12_08665 [Agrobacterium tumefaciens]|nr:hypothetical protein [Agrobacterium tumefaciens]
MPYAFEGGICTDELEGAIPISEAQYAEALAGIDAGKIVTIVGGFSLVDAPPPGDDEHPEIDPLTREVTRRQLRLTLVRNGISLAAVDNAIAAMPEGLQKEEAQIEWADAGSFSRTHPTLVMIANQLGLTELEIDAMWLEALIA